MAGYLELARDHKAYARGRPDMRSANAELIGYTRNRIRVRSCRFANGTADVLNGLSVYPVKA